MDLFDLVAKIRVDLGDLDRGLNEAGGKLKTFSNDISKAYSNVGDLLSPAVKGFQAVEGVGSAAMDAVSAGMKGFAVAATAVGGFGTAAVKSGMAFDATMSEVSAISGATGEDFDSLRAKALEMGAKTKFSASEAASAMTYMGMASWKTQDMLDGISGIMNLAAASGEDLAATSDIVTDALTAFGLKASDSGHFADILAAASTNANTNVGMMGESFKYAAPLAGSLGFSAEDTALALGLMANSGIKASQAGTSLRTVFSNMSGEIKIAERGIGETTIATKNADGTMRSFREILVDLRSEFSNLSESEKVWNAENIFGKYAMSGVLALVNAAPEDFEKLTSAIDDCNGASEEMAAIMIDNLQGDLTLLGSAFESLQIAISDALTPMLREFAQFGQGAMAALLRSFQSDGVSGFMDALTGIVTKGVTLLAEKAPEFASVSLKFIEALADGILGASEKIIASARVVMSYLTDGLDVWLHTNESQLAEIGSKIIHAIFFAFSQAGDVISEHIDTFIPLIAEAFLSYHEALFTVGMDILGAIGKGIIENKDQIQEMASETITNMVTALRDNAPMIIEGGLALLEALVGAIVENMPLIIETGAEIVGQLITGIATASPGVQAIIATAVIPQILKIIETVSSIGGAVKSAWGVIKSIIELVAGADGIGKIISVGKKLMSGAKALFALITAHPVIAVITAIIAAVVLLWTRCEEFRNFVKGMVEAIIGFFRGLAEGISAALEGIAEFIGNVFSTAWELVQAAWGMAVAFFSGIWEGIVAVFSVVAEVLGGFFSAAWEVVQAVWSAAVEFFAGVWEGIVTVFSVVAEVLGGFFSAAWEAIQAAWSAVVEFFAEIWAGITAVFSVAAEVLGGFFSAAWEAVKAAWDAAVEFFAGVWEGITAVFSVVAEVLGGFFRDAWEAVTEVWDAAIGFFTEISDAIHETFEAVTQFLGDAFSDAWDAITGIWDLAVEFFQNVWDGIADVFSDVAEWFGNTFSDAWEAVKSAWNGVTAFFSGILEDIIGVFRGVWARFREIGGNIVDGIKQGISGAWNAFISWLGGKVGGIVDAVKRMLGIRSPSKVFAGIGENMALGLAEGWEDEYSAIKRKIENGLEFGTASVNLSANGTRGGSGNAQNARQGAGNTTVNIYSPVAVDAVQAAREWQKTAQRMAMAYV